MLATPYPPQVEFEHAVEAKGNIEVWLQRLVDGMQDTVKQRIKRAVRSVYVSAHAGQEFGGTPAKGRWTCCVAQLWHISGSVIVEPCPHSCRPHPHPYAGDGAGDVPV